ncbi:hypothetical protein N657DRAFT_574833 [Parathielavia appendiculata]|uniref:Uncharacterized protein n=1 Tax=Parathielavia appendiculata TaxID=2587402 RepID=A0AAN6TZB7_9PEZI|nr:hypothetical protein N657DRAFT_574833 [Parathielavia appendiculata]
MASGFNRDEPWSLRNLRAPEYAHSQASSLGSGIGPRWAPSVTSSDQLSERDGSEYDDAQSEYRTASTVTSQFTMRSAPPPSIFSSRDGATSSAGQSSAPSLGGPRVPIMGLFDNPAFAPRRPDQILWCEFARLMNCHATFSLDDEIGWIQHHINHLRDTYPRELMCWFCDYHPFVAWHYPEDGFANFEERMQHVRGHILSDHRLTNRAMRRDLHMVAHLYHHGLLSAEEYKAAMEYDETPAAFRLPGSHSSSLLHRPSIGYQPAAPRERQQYHDLDREERRRQRERQGRNHGKRR